MARILIGNIKGPQGPQGIQGVQGPIGPVGPQGPLPPLANNGLTTQAGKFALDAAYGKKLTDDLTTLNSEMLSVKTDLTGLEDLQSKNISKNEAMLGIDFNQMAIIKGSDSSPYSMHFYKDYNWIAGFEFPSK